MAAAAGGGATVRETGGRRAAAAPSLRGSLLQTSLPAPCAGRRRRRSPAVRVYFRQYTPGSRARFVWLMLRQHPWSWPWRAPDTASTCCRRSEFGLRGAKNKPIYVRRCAGFVDTAEPRGLHYLLAVPPATCRQRQG